MRRLAFRSDRYTVEEFDEIEMNAPEDERWELIDGRIFKMMTGGTVAHNQIVQNFAFAIRGCLKRNGSSCSVFTENLKFSQVLRDSATYPDVIVTCEALQNDANRLHSPVILVEVLSKSSRDRDRNEKWQIYSAAPSLQHYVLVDQFSPTVEIWSRQVASGGATWTWQKLEDLSGTVQFADLGISVALSEIYELVFPDRGSEAAERIG